MGSGSMSGLLATLCLGLTLIARGPPRLVKSGGDSWAHVPWYLASREQTGRAPDALAERLAVVQVYAAQTFGWRGIVAIHTWIVTKPAEDDAYTRWDVVGWGGGRVVRRDYASPDAMWYGHHPRLLVDLRGPEAAALIPAIEAAVESDRKSTRLNSSH